MTDAPATPSPGPRREPWLVLGVAALFMVVQAPLLGIWEPWEADVAAVIEGMRSGSWLQVVAADGRAVAELPYGYWPSAALAAVLGTNELSLRLPGLLLALPTVLLAFLATRRIYGRFAAWFAALSLLCMPLFVFHGRIALGAGVSMNLAALSALAFLHLGGGSTRAGWAWLAWGALAAAGLTGGLPALAGPLAVLVAVALKTARSEGVERVVRSGPDAALRFGFLGVVVVVAGLLAAGELRWGTRVGLAGGVLLLLALCFASDAATLRRLGWARTALPLLPVGVSLVVLGLGLWQAVAAVGDDTSVRALLLWADGLDGPTKAAERPAFHAFVHQIGYGLFPLGAFVPLAFAELLWHPTRADEPGPGGVAGPAVAAWFAVGFLAPALGAPLGHAGFFLAAPAVAVAVGIYFARALRSPPEPLLALAAVLILALLDSNLKHQTQALADTLVTGTVDAFPPSLPFWNLARFLDLLLLAVLLIYQGGLLRFAQPVVRTVFYPTRRVRWFNPVLLVLSAVVAAVGLSVPRDAVERLIMAPAWGRLVVDARWVLVFAVLWLTLLVVLHLVHALRVKRLAGQQSGLLLRATAAFEALLRRPRAPWVALGAVLLVWGAFLNLVVASSLTTHFSQKEIFDRYQDLAQDGEPLFKYLLAERGASFYAERLQALDQQGFRDKADDAERFFAIVPRKDLARINNEFRGVSTRTLPVLDDRSHRFLLVSNQLRDGEEDRNPITRALLTELPPEANKSAITFEDQIELVGWALDPPVPRPGAEVTFKLYWKAKKRISGRWKVFVHLDAPGQRVHGDHDPVEGLFPTDNWKPGDLVQDEHRVVIKRTTAAARFTLYVGLYRGDTRMKITVGDKDNENRARLGGVNVR